MYSDKISSGSRKRSVKDRLGENAPSADEPSRRVYTKRFQGYDGKWQHDMYNDVDNRSMIKREEKIETQDLRSKLKKTVPRGIQGGNGNLAVGVKDLRDKLSGATQPVQPRPPQPVSQQRSSTGVKVATAAGATNVSASKPVTAKPAGVQKGSTGGEAITINAFLQSLGLTKYLITFQAEEIDMSVLRMMKDEELKELGIPMGPRKKIALALASQLKR